ncbi:hypothetical protein ABS764_09735 [Flavobacterium sp. ST-87]|uniref:DUF4367 domain-containing protein n=1 Tax=Flavobacterium plantiphilum TaxID=3163297 RepID=A0ABW8XU00_9FLAO
MKNLKTIGILFLAAISFISCDDSDDNQQMPATAAEFANVRQAALDKMVQEFTINAEDGATTLTSENGVKITLNGNCLTKDGNPVTGAVKIEYVEIFNKGNMLVTNKPTMGIMPDGKRNLLISGGEFFIKASQNGKELATTCNISLQVPTDLTGGVDNTMTLWNGIIDDEGNLAWEDARKADGNGGKGGVEAGQNTYYVSFGNFGWTNVDRFYSDPRPKTTILADAPEGYDNINSSIYLSYDGEGNNALAKLDTHTAEGLFSEHYGQIPVGLECHVIFVTEDNGMWRYAIKGVTVQANDVYTFTMGETTVGTEAQLIAAINAIQ